MLISYLLMCPNFLLLWGKSSKMVMSYLFSFKAGLCKLCMTLLGQSKTTFSVLIALPLQQIPPFLCFCGKQNSKREKTFKSKILIVYHGTQRSSKIQDLGSVQKKVHVKAKPSPPVALGTGNRQHYTAAPPRWKFWGFGTLPSHATTSRKELP